MRNRVTELLRIAKCKYYKNRLSTCTGDAKGTWKVINDVLNRSKHNNNYNSCNNKIPLKRGSEHLVLDKDIASSFNDYFVNVADVLTVGLRDHHLDPLNYLGETVQSCLVMSACSRREVREVVGGFKDVASGHDDIPIRIIREVIVNIIESVTHIFNIMLKSGIFPNQLKITKVVPLYKSKDKENVANYRSISILPAFSKIAEKLIYSRIESFLDEHNITTESQHGFRTKNSTTSETV